MLKIVIYFIIINSNDKKRMKSTLRLLNHVLPDDYSAILTKIFCRLTNIRHDPIIIIIFSSPEKESC